MKINYLALCVFLLTTLVGGCSSLESAEREVLAVPDTGSTSLNVKVCRTFGFRNWSLQRGEGEVTLSAEANMPTPAWSIELHERAGADNGSLELIVETVAPSGLSNMVLTWVSFEKTIPTPDSTKIEVKVRCADDVVWTSSAG